MIDRNVRQLALSSLRHFRVTVINGPRQSGKTTLLRDLVADLGTFTTLDDDQTLQYALFDPTSFVDGVSSPLAIDEVQRGGDRLVLAVKASVDRSGRPGSFLLAGSTRFLTVPQLSESLAGRAEIIDLWPFSQGEIVGVRDRFIDVAFVDPRELVQTRPELLTREDLFARVVAGGFPEPLALPAEVRGRWFRNYLRTVIERDVVEASAVRQADELPRMVRLLAANTAGELVPSRIAGDLKLGDDATRRYLSLLELVGLLVRIPAWVPSLTTREKRHPKAVLVDTGLAAASLGLGLQSLLRAPSQMAGSLLESFVTMELVKQSTWADTPVVIRHWRDRGGAEVDLIVEAVDGRIVAIEVKASQSVTPADLRHLQRLRDALGDRFVAGIVLHLSTTAAQLGDRLCSLPVSTLWSQFSSQ